MEKDGALIFGGRVVPRASKSEIVGEHDGAANTELIKVLAKFFNLAKSAVEITGGQTSKTKQIKIVGAKVERFADIQKA